jgi:hypothetical protein
MSSLIWTRCEASSRIRPLSGRPWRVVEAQHLTSTRKLVDSADEQAVLEGLLERAKPPIPADPAFSGLHFLLTTSFRYPPLRHGSRFSTRHERSLWYGSKEIRTAFAEAAYYRFLFLDGTTADLERLTVEISAFRVRIRTRRGLDLTRPPFDGFERKISAPDRYDESQALGAAMREAGVEAFRYVSARDPSHGTNVALFTPAAFDEKRPEGLETWTCFADRRRVEFQRRDFFDRPVFRFEREAFVVAGRLPAPAP